MIRRPPLDPDRVALARQPVAAPGADVADDDVVGVDHQGRVGERDAAARRALAGDGDARLADDEIGGEPDRAGDVEEDGARPARLDRRAQAARAAVGEAGDAEHGAAAPARGEAPRALRARKGERSGPPAGPREKQEQKEGGRLGGSALLPAPDSRSGRAHR